MFHNESREWGIGHNGVQLEMRFPLSLNKFSRSKFMEMFLPVFQLPFKIGHVQVSYDGCFCRHRIPE